MVGAPLLAFEDAAAGVHRRRVDRPRLVVVVEEQRRASTRLDYETQTMGRRLCEFQGLSRTHRLVGSGEGRLSAAGHVI